MSVNQELACDEHTNFCVSYTIPNKLNSEMKIYQLTILIFLLLKLNISYASRLKREINDETEHKLKLNLNNDTLIFAHVVSIEQTMDIFNIK